MRYILEIFQGVTNNFFRNIRRSFTGINSVWHIIAIILTLVLVMTGFDWMYFKLFSHGWILYALIPATVLGFLIPLFLPIILLFRAIKTSRILPTAYAVMQAGLLGLVISDFYKAFTGRVHPILFSTAVDLSHQFRFGFWRGGIFWGWPSSHTAVAFAVAVTLVTLYPRSNKIKFWAWAYAFYVGIGVSISIHWFSDFAAGAIIGSVIGRVVGESYINFQLHGQEN